MATDDAGFGPVTDSASGGGGGGGNGEATHVQGSNWAGAKSVLAAVKATGRFRTLRGEWVVWAPAAGAQCSRAQQPEVTFNSCSHCFQT